MAPKKELEELLRKLAAKNEEDAGEDQREANMNLPNVEQDHMKEHIRDLKTRSLVNDKVALGNSINDDHSPSIKPKVPMSHEKGIQCEIIQAHSQGAAKCGTNDTAYAGHVPDQEKPEYTGYRPLKGLRDEPGQFDFGFGPSRHSEHDPLFHKRKYSI